MRVFLSPTGLCAGARAMQRISRALAKYAPPTVEIVNRPDAADMQVLYVIAPDALEAGRRLVAQNRRYAAIQCCWKSLGVGDDDWAPFWQGSALTWSYYDMTSQASRYGFNFYHSPLGLDDAFVQPFDLSVPREPLVVTTGYSQLGEAISEVWKASSLVGLRCIHIGPNRVEGMTTVPDNWTAREGVTDEELASIYRSATWVSGLRFVEGFELPCAEGIACGARPIMFNRWEHVNWFGHFPYYVEECRGDELVEKLVVGFRDYYPATTAGLPISEWAQGCMRERFNWKTICTEFWRRLLAS